jgi:transcriptional regulator EpsA
MNFINTQNTGSPLVEEEVELTAEQRVVFMEVIEESLRVSQRTHLFNWLQRGMQYLIGHEVMLFGVKASDSDLYDYEFFTSSRYFGEEQFNAVLRNEEGIVRQAIGIWRKNNKPVLVSIEPDEQLTQYSKMHASEQVVKDSELKQFVVHGFGDTRSRVSTVVALGRLSSPMTPQTAHLLELIMPHLHCALIKVTSNRIVESIVLNKSQLSKKITTREVEVLQWLYLGKTNWEISTILEISPLTVKNHVQNIIRKLNVENRGQAAAKAAKLGLVIAS